MNTDSAVAERAARVTTLGQLRGLLRQVQEESGKSIRDLGTENSHAKGQEGLSKSSISRHLGGDGALPLAFVQRFSAACGLAEAERDALVTAWRRVRADSATSTSVPGQPPEDDLAARPDPDPAHLDTLAVMMDVAARLDGENGLPAARSLYERVGTARSELLGPDDPRTLEATHNLGTVLGQLDEHDTACRVLSATHRARTRVLGPDAPATLKTLENLAIARAELGQLDAARELLEEVLAARRPEGSPGHAGYADTAEKLMTVLGRAGDQVRRRQLAAELERARTASRDAST
ncbi:tetratricopeptide repeat protein [Micromonospora cathayae]|uniref:Tetratricopeptide repeat protein n=1 Tax=Micromonospora cathayae TaxID=3028804 RepID=A0ABY7ZLC6_9ACTN|nr:tetratricopeptide repeat protein [Micromonospora sp. HUAS 3]WDZ83766.1 tetratricopeptide repeat protein [Micromonospora sp. HUAS 3]